MRMFGHEYLKTFPKGCMFFGIIPDNDLGRWYPVPFDRPSRCFVLTVYLLLFASGEKLKSTFTSETVAPGLRIQPWKRLRLLLWMVTFLTFIVVQRRLSLSLCFFSFFVKMNSGMSPLTRSLPNSISTARLNPTFCIDQMLLLIFSVIPWYYIITALSLLSFPTGTAVTSLCIVSQHSTLKRWKVQSWWLPSYQVSSEATAVFNKEETHPV